MAEGEERVEAGKAEVKPPEVKTPSEADAKRLIDMITTIKDSELVPVLDAVHGCRYPEAEKLVGSAEGTFALLEKLAEEGILKKKRLSKILSCPVCHSPNIATLALCPYCKSFNIQKNTLLEHLKCGYIGTDAQFTKEGKLLCPKCNTPLTKEDYRKIGVWFECHECKKRFSEPLAPKQCRNCNNMFQVKEADLIDCFAYSLSGEAGDRAKKFQILSPLSALFRSAGYSVESPGKVQGRSGVSHQTDLLAVKGEEGLLIDVVRSEPEVGEQPVITMFAKMYDLNPPSRVTLVALPRLSDRARQLAALYQINVIEGRDAEEVIAKIKETLLKS